MHRHIRTKRVSICLGGARYTEWPK